MAQLVTKDGVPLLQFLSVDEARTNFTVKRQCPFIGLEKDAATLMSYPTLRNHCHRLRLSQDVKPSYQRTHCLTFAHRHCPVLLGASVSVMPSHIAAHPVRQRSIFMLLGITSIFIFGVIAFFMFGGLQSTRASNCFFEAHNTPTQQEIISTPGLRQIRTEQAYPRFHSPDPLP